ncbi:MAG: glycoside hydrolase family 13 protein, partial [Cytophagales bacterium]|jgi:glycosidase|tara:strand:+ start:3143 stop:5005 length:1863 start_codon:yes stop_codon:yes gene_type:complete
MTYLRSILLLTVFALSSVMSSAQDLSRVEPPFWWAGMANQHLQLMIYGTDIAELSPQIDYPGVSLTKTTQVKNPNYLFIDLQLTEEVVPGTFEIEFRRGKKIVQIYTYELKERRENSALRQGFNSSDVLYLITPDRYANGDPSNDEMPSLKEKSNRTFLGGRHGGDIQGMQEHLDYVADMGFTCIWLNPVLENDMAGYSYHGYSTTDFYKVDARFGSNEAFRKFSLQAKEKGVGLIMDMIINHSGSEHWWMKDFPMDDWVNYQAEFLKGEYHITTHRKPVVQDPYRSKIDVKEFSDGWFVPTMPDLNQRNEFMSTYLLQNSIWWIEYADLKGIRMDTYPYPDMDYLSKWSCGVMNEYPNFNIVGEEWYEQPAVVAHWQKGKESATGHDSCLPSLMDFPLQSAFIKSLNDDRDWDVWVDAYAMLALDFIYPDPENLVVFPDNHDMSRFFTQVNENFDLFKLGIAYYATIRGIPQFYYGTEILMSNPGSEDHGLIRSDFPGGWEGDQVNGFTGAGLTAQQLEAQQYMKKILNWRKGSEAVHKGELMHYNPKEGVYVFFRYTEKDKVMIILNKNKTAKGLEFSRFGEMIQADDQGVDIISNQMVDFSRALQLDPLSAMIIELN